MNGYNIKSLYQFKNKFSLIPIHNLDPQFDYYIEELFKFIPSYNIDVDTLRKHSKLFSCSVNQMELNFADFWQFSYVLFKNIPIGIFCAYFNSHGCFIRRKNIYGAELIKIPPYINVGPSILAPKYRGTGLYSYIYQIRFSIIQKLLELYGESHNVPILVGVRGNVFFELKKIYSRYGKFSPFIPHEAFTEHCWSSLSKSRIESKPAEIMARRFGLLPIGFKKTDGGIVLSNFNEKLFE